MNYTAYKFTVEPVQPGSEILITFLADMGFESFENSEKGFTAYIKESELANVNLEALTFEDFSYGYTIEKLAAQNWNEEWEKNFEPVLVDDLLCIRAPFHEKKHSVKHEIVIMPKMSFGTGHHQTTRLMCKEMFNTALKNKRVLDMGCGTGILAILAKKLGASSVLGIDIDEWSVTNARENCNSNLCQDIEIKMGDVDLLKPEQAFDLILANINKNILKVHLPHYAEKLVSGGKLFLSGFFTTDTEELTDEAKRQGLVLNSIANEDEWAVMVLEKAATR